MYSAESTLKYYYLSFWKICQLSEKVHMALWEYWGFPPSLVPEDCQCNPRAHECGCPSSWAALCVSPAPAEPPHKWGFGILQWRRKDFLPAGKCTKTPDFIKQFSVPRKLIGYCFLCFSRDSLDMKNNFFQQHLCLLQQFSLQHPHWRRQLETGCPAGWTFPTLSSQKTIFSVRWTHSQCVTVSDHTSSNHNNSWQVHFGKPTTSIMEQQDKSPKNSTPAVTSQSLCLWGASQQSIYSALNDISPHLSFIFIFLVTSGSPGLGF